MNQTYSNHRRYYAWHHFVVQPLLIINLIVESVRLYRYQTAYNAWLVILALALILFSLTARSMALKAQTRVIRLEERLRLATILSAEDHSLIDRLKPGQLVALRFASDEELPDLARRTAAGEFNTNTEIKKSIKRWKPDYLRV
jgi:hypothetical protein